MKTLKKRWNHRQTVFNEKKTNRNIEKSGKKPFKNYENQQKRRKTMKNPIIEVEKPSKIQSKT